MIQADEANPNYKQYLVNRIISGRIPIKIKNNFGIAETIYYIQPSLADKVIADELYFELLSDYSSELLTDEELNDYLCDIGAWTDEYEDLLVKLPKDIEQLKVKSYESYLKSDIRKLAKKTIKIAQDKMSEILSIKNHYAYLTASGTASLEKIKYLTGRSLFKNGKRIFNKKNFWKQSNSILEQAISYLNKTKLSEPQFRLLSRTEPWRSYWSTKDTCLGIFNKSSVNLTEDQKELINWSLLYDGIFGHPDCPPDDVIDDDDCLDGFLILDKRKRDKDKISNKVENSITNERIQNADEVYIVADNVDDAEKINNLNSDIVKSRKKVRERIISKAGEVDEKSMPDVKQKFYMELNKMASKTINGG